MTLIERALRKLPLGLARLPEHPYEEQFRESMDLPPPRALNEILMIASTPRCGSHLLGHMLGDHGGFGVPLEYLHPGNADYWKRRFGTADLNRLFPRFVKHRTSANGRFVTKAHWTHFENVRDDLDGLTGGMGIDRIVWIHRRAILSQAISLVIARQTGMWIAGATPTGQASYDGEAIVEAAWQIYRHNANWKAYLTRDFKGEAIALAYEDLLDTSSRGYRALHEFLALSHPLVPAARTARQGSGLNGEWKARFHREVAQEHAWILEDWPWDLRASQS